MSFDKLAAIYVFCSNFHSGQNSRLYKLGCRIQRQYKLELRGAHTWRVIEDGRDENWRRANEIYQVLVINHGVGYYHS